MTFQKVAFSELAILHGRLKNNSPFRGTPPIEEAFARAHWFLQVAERSGLFVDRVIDIYEGGLDMYCIRKSSGSTMLASVSIYNEGCMILMLSNRTLGTDPQVEELLFSETSVHQFVGKVINFLKVL